MTTFEQLFGTDLRLLGNLENAEQRERGSDLFTAPRPESDQVDLQRLTGVENLQQALLIRFLTEVGELTHLGHPTYGSRLHELVGRPNTEGTRNLAKLYALQALQAEPRIERVRSVDVVTDRRRPTFLEIRAAVVTIDDPVPTSFVFGVDLGGAA
jgi:phage baseplate assembly protein W